MSNIFKFYINNHNNFDELYIFIKNLLLLESVSDMPIHDELNIENLNTHYGSFYPGNWNVSRNPWTRSPEKLLKHHLKRIQELELEEYEIDPVDDINRQQGVLERINIEAGFLVPPHLQDEMGRITWEGRYRVWKEVWLLNYFGIAGKG